MNNSHNATLISAAVAAAMGLGISSAMAFEMNIYGVGHMSMDSNDDGSDSQLYIASNASRLGFKGNHAINNSIKVIFQYESGVDLTGRGSNDGNGPANNANSLFTNARDSYVGVSGSFGSVVTGRLPALNQWLYNFNLFADQIGDLGNIWGGTGLADRINGAIAYALPDMGNGIDGRLTFIPENGTANNDSLIAVLNYNNSAGLKLGGAYFSYGQGTGNPEHTAAAITASYDMGAFSVGGGYQTESDMGGTAGNDRNSYTLGGSFKIGSASTIKAQYVASNADAANSDATQIAVGYDYAVDKSTTAYLAYSSTSNDSSVNFTANNYGHGQGLTIANGADPSSISVGIVYKFDTRL